MEGKNILITGVSGMLGAAISRELSKDYRIIGMDVNPPNDGPFVNFYKTDLTEKASIEESLKRIATRFGDKLCSVIHLAAYYDFEGEPSDLYEKLTVNGTRALIKGLKNLDFDVEQFLFTSTHLVMKSADIGELITENDELKADWDYPQSKIDAEKVLREELGGIKSAVLRVSGVYDENGHSPPICNQIQRIYEKKLTSHFYPGDKDKGQPFVHLEDVVKAVKLTVANRNKLSQREVFFIAEPELLTYGQLQNRIGMLVHGKKWWTSFTPKPLAKAGAYAMNKTGDSNFIKPWMIDLTESHYPLSLSQARNKLGFIAEHRLYEELPGIVKKLLDTPAEWYKVNNLGEAPETKGNRL